MKAVVPFLVLLLLAGSAAQAFPPSPHYTLYGLVRDETGQTITVPGAVLIKLGNLVLACPEIAELDLNPLLASPEGVVALDARIVLQ